MSSESFVVSKEHTSVGGEQFRPENAPEHLIELDEDLFPWVDDGEGDDPLNAVALAEERPRSGNTAGPAWRRIERYKERQRLRRRIEDILQS